MIPPLDSELNGVAEATDISSIEAANGNGSIDGSSLTDIDGMPMLLFKPLMISTLSRWRLVIYRQF